MYGKELYDYCRMNPNTNRYLNKETADPLWNQVEVMLRAKQNILAFEINVEGIAVYLWAELTANCRLEVNIKDALDVVANYYLPALETLFKERIEQTYQASDKEFAILCNGKEAVMLYGENEIMKSARLSFDVSGIAAFYN